MSGDVWCEFWRTEWPAGYWPPLPAISAICTSSAAHLPSSPQPDCQQGRGNYTRPATQSPASPPTSGPPSPGPPSLLYQPNPSCQREFSVVLILHNHNSNFIGILHKWNALSFFSGFWKKTRIQEFCIKHMSMLERFTRDICSVWNCTGGGCDQSVSVEFEFWPGRRCSSLHSHHYFIIIVSSNPEQSPFNTRNCSNRFICNRPLHN